jgi:hypothetical protein
MSTEYFSYFPVINYNGDNLVNICVRADIPATVKNNTAQYAPYELRFEQETQETVAFDYYTDVNLDWLVEMTNDVIDPYFDWKISDSDIESLLINNYGSIANAMNTIVYSVRLTGNNDPYNVIVSSQTQVSNVEYVSINAYDHMFNLNGTKLGVYLLNTQFVDQIKTSISDIFNAAQS